MSELKSDRANMIVDEITNIDPPSMYYKKLS